MTPAETEQYRHECEVRYAVSKGKDWSREFLGNVRKARGEAQYVKLRDALATAFRANPDSKAGTTPDPLLCAQGSPEP